MFQYDEKYHSTSILSQKPIPLLGDFVFVDPLSSVIAFRKIRHWKKALFRTSDEIY